MKIKKLMTTDVAVCSPKDTLAAAGAAMFRRDCGMLPVVHESKVVGAITDRDIAIASATRNLSPSEILVGEVSNRKPVTCGEDEKAEEALAAMRKHRVRRIPVIGDDGSLVGIVSLSDFLHASKRQKSLRKEVLKTARKISAPCPIVLGEMR
jgi:CBS domain-containing protein